MILSGKTVSDAIQDTLQKTIQDMARSPSLAVIVVGDNPASKIYVDVKKKACARVGIQSIVFSYPSTISEPEILTSIDSLNLNDEIDGILVQMPLPGHINSMRVIESISPEKDVDGFHPVNMGKLLLGKTDGFVPCTPLGIKVLLEKYQIQVEGKHVVIVGRSNIVGKPLAALLMQKFPGSNATVTVAHTKTDNLIDITRSADILIAAVGVPHFIQENMVSDGAVVVDVGIHRIPDETAQTGYRVVGDVDFRGVEPKCSAITPVPKGVGPMTVVMLLQNTLTSHQKKWGALS